MEDGMGFLKNGKSPTFFLALFPSFQYSFSMDSPFEWVVSQSSIGH
jgi:hypothetical protein